MRTFFISLGVLLTSAAATAQTIHPCDVAAPTQVTVQSNGTYRARFCARPEDNPEAFVVYLNGTASDLRPLTMVVAAGATGWAVYEGPQELRFPIGSYQIQVSLYNRLFAGGPTQEGEKSQPPLSLIAAADNPPAVAPKVLGVVK